jgi:hypothetical protein
MGMSPAEGINISGTNSGRMSPHVSSESAKLRGKFAGLVGEAGREGQNTASYFMRWGLPGGEGVGYMQVGETPAQAAPVTSNTEAPSSSDIAQLNKLSGKQPPTIDVFSNEGVG